MAVDAGIEIGSILPEQGEVEDVRLARRGRERRYTKLRGGAENLKLCGLLVRHNIAC
jgi:hypothetical protein